MSIISYAQNFEDVMLWRCFKNIDNGYYIDVGAAWESVDSVTKLFYERGWSGINIEPNNSLFEVLSQNRSRDINLNVAVSDTPGKVDICFLDNAGLSTAVEEIAEKHQLSGEKGTVKAVEAVTLDNIWDTYVPTNQDVHFLKIDVEGLEYKVIKGFSLNQNRPWVILVESTLPMTQTECHDEWETLLIEHGYHFVYADGLNRFYIAEEKLALKSNFKYPPNIWDNYITAPMSRKNEENTTLIELLDSKQKEIESLNETLETIRSSNCWKITYPYRFLANKFFGKRR
ncbi:FkbM family methyltransferase [Vibrio cholerae]|uniref:FkbM family methyltransferase n=1 Tax=Vibrio cholerae TaxID=666 RepID=UPI00372854D7